MIWFGNRVAADLSNYVMVILECEPLIQYDLHPSKRGKLGHRHMWRDTTMWLWRWPSINQWERLYSLQKEPTLSIPWFWTSPPELWNNIFLFFKPVNRHYFFIAAWAKKHKVFPTFNANYCQLARSEIETGTKGAIRSKMESHVMNPETQLPVFLLRRTSLGAAAVGGP